MQRRHHDKEYSVGTVECGDLSRDTSAMKVVMVGWDAGLRETVECTFRQELRWKSGVATK